MGDGVSEAPNKLGDPEPVAQEAVWKTVAVDEAVYRALAGRVRVVPGMSVEQAIAGLVRMAIAELGG